MHALELRDPRRVISSVANARSITNTTPTVKRPRRVRKALLVALALSMLVHVLWTFWPVDTTPPPESTVLTATLTEMPPPPVPSVEAPVAPAPAARATRPPSRRIAAATRHPVAAPDVQAAPADDAARGSGDAAPAPVERTLPGAVTAAPEPADTAANEPPPRALPPRVDLAYKVFLGTQGFMIGDATYRFEHSGDRYRISTVGQARGLAALLVRGTGKVESQGRITANGLRPYEFAIERGSADRREVAFFDWEAGNVVLHDGATAVLEAPAFDPLTILWQPYFSPPGTADQSFGIATTRKVGRYTLKLQAEETIAWRRGDIVTQRWHQVSDDGKMEAWLWLAPSMHYVPIKMRLSRTSRGTLEVLLDSIRADNAEAYGLTSDPARDDETSINAVAEVPRTVDDITFNMPDSGMPALPLRDMRGQ